MIEILKDIVDKSYKKRYIYIYQIKIKNLIQDILLIKNIKNGEISIL